MKTKGIKYVFSCFLAVYFIFAGVGFNVIKYCCDDCRELGIEDVAVNSCETVHQDAHHGHAAACLHNTEDMACSDAFHQSSCCHLLRLEIEPTVVSALQYMPVVNEIEIDLHLLYSIVSELADMELLSLSTYSPTHILSQGRIVLSQNCILLI